MVMALNCLTVARARLMLAGFLVCVALPALSSLPHSGVSQLKALSSIGPFNAWADAVPAKHKAPTAAAMIVSLFIADSPPGYQLLFWFESLLSFGMYDNPMPPLNAGTLTYSL